MKIIFILSFLIITSLLYADPPSGIYGGGNGNGFFHLLDSYKELNGDVGGTGASQFSFLQQPIEMTTNTPFAVLVATTDASGRLIIEDSKVITLARTGSDGTLGGTLTRTTVNGLVTFNNISINAIGTYRLTANSVGLTGESNEFDVFTNVYKGGTSRGEHQILLSYKLLSGSVGGAGASQISFVQHPVNIVNNSSFAVSVAATDASGRIIIEGNNSVNLASIGGGGSLGGTINKTMVNGLAFFNDLILNTTGSYRLTADALGLTQGLSNLFDVYSNVYAGGNGCGDVFLQLPNKTLIGIEGPVANTLAFFSQPFSCSQNDIIPTVSVELLSSRGRRILTSTDAITLQSSGGEGTLSGTSPKLATLGLAYFDDLRLSETGTYQLLADATGFTQAISTTFDIYKDFYTGGEGRGEQMSCHYYRSLDNIASTLPVTQISFAVEPSETGADLSIWPFVAASLNNNNGRRVTTAANEVTLAIGTNPASGTLAGTLVKNAAAGYVTFSDAGINNAGAGYTLTANASGLGGATSATFDIIGTRIFTNGTSDGLWANAMNWTGNTTPASGEVAVIQAEAILDETAIVRQLIISNTVGSKVTLNPAAQLTVTGTFRQLTPGVDKMEFKSDSTGTGSLLNNSPYVLAKVNNNIQGGSHAWHLISSPLKVQSAASGFTPSGPHADGSGYDSYLWNEPSGQWVSAKNLSNGWTDFYGRWQAGSAPYYDLIHAGRFIASADYRSDAAFGHGKLEAYFEPGITSLSGELNHGSITVPLTVTTGNNAGAMLLGNPYPSSIDWKADAGWERDMLRNDGGGKSMYIWNQEVSNYGVFISNGTSGTNGITRYIRTGQGFFVMASTAGNFKMKEEARVHSGGGNVLKSGATENPMISLSVVSQGNGSDEALVEFGEGLNGGAQKMFGLISTAPQLWIENSDNKAYSIRMESNANEQRIPVSFIPGTQGNFKLKANFIPGKFERVMLYDALTKRSMALTGNDSYNFAASNNDLTERFELLIGGLTSLPNLPQNDKSILIWYASKKLYVLTIENQQIIRLIDMQGRLLLEQQITDSGLHVLPVSAPAGIYAVSLGSKSTKICVK